jgi:hypothetical protein
MKTGAMAGPFRFISFHAAVEREMKVRQKWRS